MRISDWSSDVCSSDLIERVVAERILRPGTDRGGQVRLRRPHGGRRHPGRILALGRHGEALQRDIEALASDADRPAFDRLVLAGEVVDALITDIDDDALTWSLRQENLVEIGREKL